jgi:hypothetical protein
VTNDCWNLPSNAHKRRKYFAALDEEESVGSDDDNGEPSVGEDSDEFGQTGTANLAGCSGWNTTIRGKCEDTLTLLQRGAD